MDLRRTLNENPMITGAIAAILIAVAVWTAFSLRGGSGASGAAGTYYTVDNGATYFKTSTDEVPPFDHGGKQAVRARVYSCDDGKEFVAYLERYTDEAKSILDALATADEKSEMPDMGKVQMASTRGKLVKRPNDKEWVSSSDGAKATPIVQVKCPDGNPALPAE